jgi:hypothetical protein
LRCGGVGRFTQPDHCAGDQEKKERGEQASGERCHAPASNPGGNDGFTAEAVGEKAKWDAGNRQDHKEPGLEVPKLRIAGVQMITQQRDKRYDGLPRRKVDKIDQSKYSKEANLLGTQRNGLC